MRQPDTKGLLKLARFLYRLPRKHFDQTTWRRKTPTCGTQACVAGWAAYVFPSRFQFKADEASFFSGTYSYVVSRRTGREGLEAFADAFYLNESHAEAICAPEAPHQTPKKAAHALRRLVKQLSRKQ